MAFSGSQKTGLGPMGLPFPRVGFSAKSVAAAVAILLGIGPGRRVRVRAEKKIG